MPDAADTPARPVVLVTGAAGRIGRAFASRCAARFRLRLADLDAEALAEVARFHTDDSSGGAEPLAFDIADREACDAACAGCDAVVHLAGNVDPFTADLGELIGPNVAGLFNVFTAAADAGVRRLVFASSAQTIEAYPKDVQLGTTEPVRPDNLYGVCKVFGEALAAHYAYKRGLSAVCVRIANYRENLSPQTNLNRRDFSAYLSPGDASELLARSVEAEGVRFAIVNGVSDNRYKRMRMDQTCELLGVTLRDDAFEIKGVPPPAEKSDPSI